MTDDDHLKPCNDYWEDLFRNMLPPGAPLPDEDELDCTINVHHEPPIHPQPVTVNHHPLSANPIIKTCSPFTKPMKTSSFPHKFSALAPVVKTPDDEICSVLSFDTVEEEQELNCSSRTSVDIVEKKKTQNHNRNICSRCGKGIRLREKERCIVCDARYCGNCVLKAMGSMPEGRKCVGCIGLPIDEARRQKLGKCSRLLSKVCSEMEVRQIMVAEKECSANQLRPEQVVVNGCRLSDSDLSELLGCTAPPLKLKPGRYWYDKDSGLWGQEGEKPDRIVSSKLNVGGKLQVDASNGNTQVYINGREITKVELRILKLAKVQGTHFWLYDDGSYEEEGQNNIKGNIWGNASTRFISSLFCLPVPRHQHSHHDTSASPNLDHSRVQKFMLFGLEGSGTSTFFKQVRFLYGDKFTAEELQHVKLIIQSNTYRYLSILLEAREQFEEEEALTQVKAFDSDNQGDLKVNKSVYTLKPKFKHFCDWLLDITAMGDFDSHFPAATREYANLVHDIWRDPAIQETYKRMHFLPDVAKYFLDQVIEVSSNNYEPSDEDILYAQGLNENGLSYLDFSTNDQSPISAQSSFVKYQLIHMSTNYNGCKWLDMFEDARVVIYCVALTDYDQHSNKNKMLANRDSFESLIRHPCFFDTPFVLMLNKYDAFEEKISQTPLTVCEWFHDFQPLKPHRNHLTLANLAYYYVAMKFKELYASITGRKLFVWQCEARKRSSVEQGLRYVREVIRWDEEIKDVYYYNDNGDDDTFYNTQLEFE